MRIFNLFAFYPQFPIKRSALKSNISYYNRFKNAFFVGNLKTVCITGETVVRFVLAVPPSQLLIQKRNK